jgi:hypothetical protein
VRSLSELKIFIALLPDGCRLELLAPKPDATDPAKRLGVRLPRPAKTGAAPFFPPPSRVPIARNPHHAPPALPRPASYERGLFAPPSLSQVTPQPRPTMASDEQMFGEVTSPGTTRLPRS